MKKAKEAAVQYQTNVAKSASDRSTVTVEATLADQLRQAADWNGISLDEAADAAMLEYYYRYVRTDSAC